MKCLDIFLNTSSDAIPEFLPKSLFHLIKVQHFNLNVKTWTADKEPWKNLDKIQKLADQIVRKQDNIQSYFLHYLVVEKIILKLMNITEILPSLFQPAVGRVLPADCWAPPTAGSRGRPWAPPPPAPAPSPPPSPTRADPEVTAAKAAAERPAPPDQARVRRVKHVMESLDYNTSAQIIAVDRFDPGTASWRSWKVSLSVDWSELWKTF